MWGDIEDKKKNKKAGGMKEPWEMHKSFLDKILTRAVFLVASTNFLLVHWNGSMLLFWSQSVKLLSIVNLFPPNWRDISLLFWLAIFFSCLPLHFPFSLFTPTYTLLLPLESKQCPLTQSSVLACADAADELQFWSKNESWTTHSSGRLSKENWRYTHQVPRRLLPWYFGIFSKFQDTDWLRRNRPLCKILSDNFSLCLSRNFIPLLQKDSRTSSFSVLATNSFQFY